MSTRIHNGYRLPVHLTLETLMPWVHQVRPSLLAAAASGVFKETVKQAVATFDKRTLKDKGLDVNLGDKARSGDALWGAWVDLLDEARDASRQGRRHFADAEATMTVFHHHTGLYVLLFSQMGAIQKAFEETAGVEPFFYWNNTDPLAAFTQEQWDERGAFWDELLGESGVPADNGLSVTLVGENALWLHGMANLLNDENLVFIPTLQKRSYTAAQALPEALLPESVKEDMKKNPGSLSAVMRHMRKLSEGEIPAFNAARAHAETLLDPDLTWDKLKQPCSPKPE